VTLACAGLESCDAAVRRRTDTQSVLVDHELVVTGVVAGMRLVDLGGVDHHSVGAAVAHHLVGGLCEQHALHSVTRRTSISTSREPQARRQSQHHALTRYEILRLCLCGGCLGVGVVSLGAVVHDTVGDRVPDRTPNHAAWPRGCDPRLDWSSRDTRLLVGTRDFLLLLLLYDHCWQVASANRGVDLRRSFCWFAVSMAVARASGRSFPSHMPCARCSPVSE